MKVFFEDQEYTLDIDDMDLPDAMHIKRKTGLGLMDLHEGLARMEPDALRALYWLMLKQSTTTRTDIDRVNFKVVKFGEAVMEAILRENPQDDDEAEESPKEDETS